MRLRHPTFLEEKNLPCVSVTLVKKYNPRGKLCQHLLSLLSTEADKCQSITNRRILGVRHRKVKMPNLMLEEWGGALGASRSSHCEEDF
eukprot:13770576-Ditylum_brightwellii.AAC.1